MLPSSLTEARSSTLRDCSLPTCVGLRYGRTSQSLEAFLGGLGADDFRAIARARNRRHAPAAGLSLGYALRSVHRSCPFERLTFPTASPLRSFPAWCGAGVSYLLSIAYDLSSSA